MNGQKGQNINNNDGARARANAIQSALSNTNNNNNNNNNNNGDGNGNGNGNVGTHLNCHCSPPPNFPIHFFWVATFLRPILLLLLLLCSSPFAQTQQQVSAIPSIPSHSSNANLLLRVPSSPASSSSSSSSFSSTPCQSALLIRLPLSQFINASSSSSSSSLILVEYSPPRGLPSSPFWLSLPSSHLLLPNSSSPPPPPPPNTDFVIPINGTWPSIGYHYAIFGAAAPTANGTKQKGALLLKGMAYSSPGKPILVSIAATARTCTLAYSPPVEPAYAQREHFGFHLEYFPVDHPETVFFVRTNSTSVRLRSLRPGTQHRLALFTEFFSVRSICPLELTFRTKLENAKGTEGGEEKETRRKKINGKAESSTMANQIMVKNNKTINHNNNHNSSQNSTKMVQTAEGKKEDIGKSQMEEEEAEKEEEEEEEEEGTKKKEKEEEEAIVEETKMEEPKMEEEVDEAKEEKAEGNKEVITERNVVRMRQMPGGKLVELNWDLPELVPCDAFLLRHNATGNGGGGGGGKGKEKEGMTTLRTSSPSIQIPFQRDTFVQVNISCLFDNAISPQWAAHRLLDFRRPFSLQSVRLIRSFTDEFFLSSVLLGLGLPPHPVNFGEYEVQVAWALGKKVVGHQSSIFRGHPIVGGEGRVNISGLEPARLYTFAVRNVSRELDGHSSPPIGLRLTTPPIITSTLYAGKITTDWINMNFGDSDPEHPFEHYELHFGQFPPQSHSAGDGTGEDANDGNGIQGKGSEEGEEEEELEGGEKVNNRTRPIIRPFAKHELKSLTFDHLIPGKTYSFSLFTILHGVRSRPVSLLITTYPLKVSSLHPLISPSSGSVLLFWSVQNPARNEWCQYRLSYTASAGPHLHSAVDVQLNGTTFHHRFANLEWNIFYTFTILVIMGPPGAEAESESESITIAFPSKPHLVPLLQRYGSRELELTFQNDRDIFSDRNGVISQFAIIVAEQIEGSAEQVGDCWELASWHDVRERGSAEGDGGGEGDGPLDAFRSSPTNYNPFGRRGAQNNAKFIIGQEDCVPERRRLDEPYCNGPLRANVNYFVRIRAYTKSGIAMETQWVGINGTSSSAAGKDPPDRPRFPCYLYLNGCNNGARGGGGGGGRGISKMAIMMLLVSLFVHALLLHFAYLL